MSEKISGNIENFFSGKNQIKYSIIRFESSSNLSDLELQRFYHMIITPIERSENEQFRDLSTGFNNGKGNFDLNRINEINHFISIKLINNMGKLGAGIIIYNRNVNRIVSVKYYEEPIKKREVELLRIKDPGLSSREYSKLYDIRVSHNLLNVASCNIKGTEYVFFLLNDRIDVYTLTENSILKLKSNEVEWGRPHFPSIQNEGNLFLFEENDDIFLIVGSNFSRYSYIFNLKDNELKRIAKFDFSVADVFIINGVRYIAGFNFSFGKNFYKGKLFLKQFNSVNFNAGETYIKNLPDFYSAAFYKDRGEFRSLYLIDLNYNMRIFSDTINETPGSDSKFGYTHAISEDVIAISSYTENNDRLKMMKIGNDINTPIFNKEIKGKIRLIEKGIVEGKHGFWIIVEKSNKGFKNLKLQFWRKNID
ncbi:MAG: hypothetical protein KAS21_01325 [Candidatus Aminicenantes bacterium]|nr:hypothetical protein [Candidatus Aminicenantes bacterium]